jgi:hypothetical protein
MGERAHTQRTTLVLLWMCTCWCARSRLDHGKVVIAKVDRYHFSHNYTMPLLLTRVAIPLHNTHIYLVAVVMWWAAHCSLPRCRRAHTMHSNAFLMCCAHLLMRTRVYVCSL